MIPPIEEEYITDLKCTSPRIDLQIRRISTHETATFYHKRLQQLATQARDKVLALETGKETTAELQQ